jgi:uncharacterized membrane protein YgcG
MKLIIFHFNSTHMKLNLRMCRTRSLFLFLLICACLITHQSCTKINTDIPGGPALTNAEVTQKFFALSANAPVAVRRTAEEMKKKNVALEFVKAFIKNNGYPAWDKAIIQSRHRVTPTAFAGSSASAEGGDTIVIIPVVQINIAFVDGFVTATLNGSINLDLYRGGDYSAYSFNNEPADSISADKAAMQVMYFNYRVFGYTRFEVSDNRLLSNDAVLDTSKPHRVFEISSVQEPPQTLTGNESNLLLAVAMCVDIYQSIPCIGIFTDQRIGCSVYIGQSCYTIYVDTGGGGGGSTGPTGGSGPGGGTGGGGTGGTFPCASSQGRTIQVANPCGPANPPPVNPIPPVPPVSPVNDSIPNILSRACDRQMDSVYNWGMQNGFKEQSFILVKKDGVIYPKNYKEGTTDQTSVNYLLDPGEVLLAYFHTHAEDTVNFYRTAFDGQDLAQFDIHATEVGYAAILEVGNARYAFVLEDVQKHTAFNIAKRGQHKRNYYAKLDALMSQISNGTIASEQAMIQYLGTASTSGVGFYKASRPNKNNFTKLNP